MKRIGLIGVCLAIFAGTSFASNGTSTVFVDYSRPLADLIKDCNFDWVSGDITEENFPITKHLDGEVETKLFHFNRFISSDEAIREMKKAGYRPAELSEALAYAKANPDEQRKYPIMILGSVWRDFDGYRNESCLCFDGSGRNLDLHWCGLDWSEGFRFLALCKS